VRIGPTAWPFTGFIHTDRQLDKYILDFYCLRFCFRLLEVLELPQLAETCVRNGHYEEALELKQYVTRLNKKLGSIPIVAEVVQVISSLSGLH